MITIWVKIKQDVVTCSARSPFWRLPCQEMGLHQAKLWYVPETHNIQDAQCMINHLFWLSDGCSLINWARTSRPQSGNGVRSSLLKRPIWSCSSSTCRRCPSASPRTDCQQAVRAQTGQKICCFCAQPAAGWNTSSAAWKMMWLWRLQKSEGKLKKTKSRLWRASMRIALCRWPTFVSPTLQIYPMTHSGALFYDLPFFFLQALHSQNIVHHPLIRPNQEFS